jgi:hypothetical protein
MSKGLIFAIYPAIFACLTIAWHKSRSAKVKIQASFFMAMAAVCPS